MSLESLIHAPDSIVASLLYIFICFVTIAFLLVIYFNKRRSNSMRSHFFRIIIYSIIALLFTDSIIELFLFKGVTGWIYRIVHIIHWESFIWWFSTYRVYNLLFLSGVGDEEWPKKGGYKKLYTELPISRKIMWNDIVRVIAMIVYLFMPFQMIDPNNINFMQGMAEYYVALFMFVSGAISLYETLFIYKDQTLFNKMSVVFVYSVMLVAIICQYLIKDTTVYCLCSAIQIYFLYFMVENPDIMLRREIENLKSGIDKSNKAKTDFLSNMSHEIRTPMNAIVGFSDSLLTNPDFDAKTARADIENIYTAGNNLVDIINNILDISKIESEQNTINSKNCNLDKIVKELASVIKSRIGKKPIEFITELDEHIPSVIWGDSTKIYQILLNISNNSVKYTEVGKIKLTCIPETVDSKEVILHFKITDTGYGIKKEDFDKVFKKYSRLDDATDNEIEGTGLGLVITKQFVELMGGKIWFTSEFEVGTTFFIDIPFKVIDETPIGKQKDVSSEKTDDGFIKHLDCSNYTVLIVDDNDTNLKVATRLLEEYRFKIDTAKNGKDCVYKFKYGNHYDLILLDDMMPEMDGVDTVKVIKKLDVFDIPPIVAFTANAMTGMGEKYIEAGFDYYLPMPVSLQELDELVTTYFGEKVTTYVEDREDYQTDDTTTTKVEETPTEETKEEVKEETPVEETKQEEKEPEVEEKKEETPEDKAEEPKEETKAEEVKEEVKEETPVEEPKEEVKEEPKEEKSTEEEKSVEEKPAEQAKQEKEPEVEEKKEETTEEKAEEPKEKPAEEAKEEDKATEEVKEEVPAEEKEPTEEKAEEPKEEKKESEVEEKKEGTTEEKTEEPKEEPKPEEEKPVEEPKEEEKPTDEVKEEVKEEPPVEETKSEEKESEEEDKKEETTEESKTEEVKEETKEEEKPAEEPKEEVKEETPVEEEKPAEEAKEEVKEETPAEEKTEEPKEEPKPEEEKATDEVKEESKEEEKSTEEPKEEVKEPEVEEKKEETTEDKAEEPKEEPKAEETKEEKEEKPAEEPKEEEKPAEEPKAEEKEPEVEEKKEETSEEKAEESKEEPKTEEVKEEVKEEEKPAEEPKEEAKEEASSDDPTSEQEKFLRDKGVDLDKALEFLGDMEMYNMTVADFVTSVNDKWNNIKQYKDAEDMPNYAIEVHSLKSDCKYLGLMKLADVSYEHELKSKENDLEFVKANYDRLVKEYNDAIDIIKEYTEKFSISAEE